MRRLVALLVGALALAGCSTATSAHVPHAPPPSATHAMPAATARHLVIRTMAWRLPGPIAREAVSGTGGTTVTVAGGLLPGDGSTDAAYSLDLVTGRTLLLPRLAVPVHDTAGWRLGHAPVVIGGGNAAEQDAVQVLHRSRWRVAGRLPGARSDLVVVDADGQAWVLGGYDGRRAAESAILRSGDGVHWRSVGQLPVPVRYPAVAVVRGAILLFGGEANHVMQDAVQRIDLATGRARVVAHLPHGLGTPARWSSAAGS